MLSKSMLALVKASLAFSCAISCGTLLAESSSHSPAFKGKGYTCQNKCAVQRYGYVVDDRWHAMLGAQTQIFTILGTVENPDPAENEAVAASIASNDGLIDFAIAGYVAALGKMGVRPALLSDLSVQTKDFFDAAIAYSLSMNLYNTSQAILDQYTAADLLFERAQILAQTFKKIAGDRGFEDILVQMANLLTQQAQAYRSVLNTDNIFGATPSNAASEAKAATQITAQLHVAAAALTAKLTKGVAERQCRIP